MEGNLGNSYLGGKQNAKKQIHLSIQHSACKGGVGMNRKEKELFLLLCRYRDTDRKKLFRLIEEGAATPEVLGMLLANRMGGIAYHTLTETALWDRTDREFRNTLRNAALLNEKMNEDFFACLKMLSVELDSCGVPYALLKGAFLCAWYPTGCRTSNDIDVLLAPEDVGKVSAKLKASGFNQGHLKNGVFIPATRQEIIESKMTRGETVPFIKKVTLPYMRYLEVDLNFSLDYKNSADAGLKEMLNRTTVKTAGEVAVRTLDPADFLLHLCAHLYKEATTMPWVRMKRDMTFYKFCDLYALLYDYSAAQLDELFKRAVALNLQLELYDCVKSVEAFFGLPCPLTSARSFEQRLPLRYVVSPKDKKLYRYAEPDVVKRFFAKNRITLLEEVSE